MSRLPAGGSLTDVLTNTFLPVRAGSGLPAWTAGPSAAAVRKALLFPGARRYPGARPEPLMVHAWLAGGTPADLRRALSCGGIVPRLSPDSAPLLYLATLDPARAASISAAVDDLPADDLGRAQIAAALHARDWKGDRLFARRLLWNIAERPGPMPVATAAWFAMAALGYNPFRVT